jgi:hypothetical protein
MEEGFRLLLHAWAARFSFGVLQLFFADMLVEDFAFKCELDREAISRLCKVMAGRIKVRYLGVA